MASFLTAGNYLDIFEDIGEYIELIDDIHDACNGDAAGALDFVDALSEITGDLSTNGRYDVLSGTQEAIDGIRDNLAAACDTLAAFCTKRLLHRTTVLELLPVSSNATIQEVLALIVRDMNDVGTPQDINASSVSLGSVTDDATGNGNALVGIVLDGASSPGSGMAANIEYNGVNSELCVPTETMTLTCIQDSETDGLAEGEEVWQWNGGVKPSRKFDWRKEGSGTGPQIRTMNASQLILNKDFEVFTTANTPDNWDIDGGAAGSTILQETTAAQVYRGSSAFKFAGNGATATLQISQTMNVSSLIPRKRYLFTCFVKGDATVAAGTLTIHFESPSSGYTAGGTEEIVLNAAALAAQTSYDIESFYINMPQIIPNDLELVIKVTGTLTNAALVRVDSLAFAPVDWHGGVHAAVYAGSTPFRRGDRLYWTVTSTEGVFQRFFRRAYGVQLPSDTGGTETLADTLAT